MKRRAKKVRSRRDQRQGELRLISARWGNVGGKGA